MTAQEQYHELAYYTLAHRDKRFIHQHIVDAYAAQTAGASTKPITILFALAGLYLFVEKNYTGQQVQDAHLQMARKSKQYAPIGVPDNRGRVTVRDVLAAAPGADRDAMIRRWCVSVWAAFAHQHPQVIELTERLLAK